MLHQSQDYDLILCVSEKSKKPRCLVRCTVLPNTHGASTKQYAVEETEAPVRSTKSGAREELNRLWPLF